MVEVAEVMAAERLRTAGDSEYNGILKRDKERETKMRMKMKMCYYQN